VREGDVPAGELGRVAVCQISSRVEPVSREATGCSDWPGVQDVLTSGILFFCYSILGSPLGRPGWGTAMDSTALHELIAQIRGTTAALAEAEQRVASFTAELVQQAPLAQPDAKPAQPIRTPIGKRGTSGWVAAG
jgi:hypothetical protein